MLGCGWCSGESEARGVYKGGAYKKRVYACKAELYK